MSVLFMLSSCSVMDMQNFNQGLGGECLEIECESGYWDPALGEYRMGYYLKTEKGEDIEYQEKRWVQTMSDRYLDRWQITSYTEKSPYSDRYYKFNILCTEWK